ncbi:MAG: hypothetical protein ACRDOF_09020 [Gaiellaceae bacterium]
MSTAEQHPQHEELSQEDRRVIDWRFDQFRSLGFGEQDSWLLAGADADLHLVRTLVGAGCPQHLVLGIVL